MRTHAGMTARALSLAALLLWTLSGSVAAQGTAAEGDAYSRKGADTCLKCHDEDSAFPVLPIFRTAHGNQHNPGGPFGGGLQCEACHGAAGAHPDRYGDGEQRPAMPAFGANATRSAAEQNGQCLSCHNNHAGRAWADSPHADADLRCSDCHSIHSAQDRISQPQQQTELCSGCHTQQRAELLQISAHPLRQGAMACGDCHEPHGQTLGDALLIRSNTRDTCLDCHAEKRGPFLWEHAPAAEDCGQCHRPHGSNHRALLTVAKPLLCQQCHSQAGHPSVPYTANGLPTGNPSGFVLLNSCSNCHDQVHGSNHPSGAGLLR